MTFDRLDPDLLSALLEAQFRHAQATLFLNNEPTPFSSTLLGFDYYENTLLIDGLEPPIDRKLRQRLSQRPFWMQIRAKVGYINILCLLKEVQHDLYTLDLLEGELTNNRRWSSRLVFPTRSGPLTRFQPRQAPIQEGFVRDLSVSGANIEFYGRDVRDVLPENSCIPITIVFNEQFQLAASSHIVQHRFLRKPCCFTQLRVKFAELEEVSRMQLSDFIEALSDNVAA